MCTDQRLSPELVLVSAQQLLGKHILQAKTQTLCVRLELRVCVCVCVCECVCVCVCVSVMETCVSVCV